MESPQKYDNTWGSKTAAQKEGLLKHLGKEIATFQRNIDQAMEELEGRKMENDKISVWKMIRFLCGKHKLSI